MPRLVDETEAAKTVGIPVATFRAWVESGRLPAPLPDCGLYDIKGRSTPLSTGSQGSAGQQTRSIAGG